MSEQLQERTAHKVIFGAFEADLRSEELRRDGVRVKIQRQPFQLLAALLERPGVVVTREELQQKLWGNNVTVDFDHSLNAAMNKIREALEDSAENPRYIETLARRGYRFLIPVVIVAEQEQSEVVPPPSNRPESERDAPGTRIFRAVHRLPVRSLLFAGMAVIVLIALIGGWLRTGATRKMPQIRQLTFSGRVSPGAPIFESLPAIVTDGSRIYYTEIQNGQTTLNQVSIRGGEVTTLPLPKEVLAPSLSDISRDGTKLLIRNHLSPDTEQVLWIVPTTGGVVRRLSSIVAHDATWMRDGLHILYATENDLYVANENGDEIRKFAKLPGRAFWLRWSPDESRLRFTVVNPNDHTSSLWEIEADGRNLQRLLPEWPTPASECCGSWTNDGRYYVFQSGRDELSNVWSIEERGFLFGRRSSSPVKVTSGPLNYVAPVGGKIGHQVFFVGLDNRVDLLSYQTAQQQFVPFRRDLRLKGRVEFSRDGKWVAWIKPEDGSLWRCRADGSERMQLSAPPLQVFLMHWSPDNKQLALMAREPGKPWKIYLISATGGDAHTVLSENRNQADPDWSPDGRLLVFGRVPELMAKESDPRFIHVLNLQSMQLGTLPGSEGFFSPRWSPDGRYIAAISHDRRVVLFNFTEKTWKVLANKTAADPSWSHDGNAIFFHDFMEPDSPIYKLAIQDGRLQRVAGLDQLQGADIADYSFTGLAPGDVPLVRARTSTANIYSLELD